MIHISEIDKDLAKEQWRINPQGYVIRSRYKSFPNEPRLMHRLIMERASGRKLTPKDFCDHINGNKLDNRRENLRLTDAVGNAQNKTHNPTRGTSWVRSMRKWLARVTYKGKRIDVGYFENREDAIRAAADKRKKLGFLERHGETPEEVQVVKTPQEAGNGQ